MEIIGIDVGFGFTKAYNGKNSVIFKSIIGDASDIQFHSAFANSSPFSNLHITLDEKSYFLGNYAELQSSIREFTLDQDRLLQNSFKVLAVAAAGLCTDTFAPIQVVSGLPVAYLKRDTKKLMEAIAGVHQITFHQSDGKNIKKTINIDKITIIPQPIGSIFNLLFDENGKFIEKSLATKKIGVVDVGFKTTDFSIFDQLQYIERGSTTMDTGISKCFSLIAAKLRQESNINIELFKMFKFIESGTIKIRGKEYNISSLKKRIYAHTAAAIAADLSRLWENDWDMDSIILTGGGSVELAEYLADSIEGNLIPIPKNLDARFNNVQGYYKFGQHKWGHARFASGRGETEKSKEEKGEEQPSEDPRQMPELDEEKPGKSSKGLSWLRRKN
jgi:plasmid segregation protein ParM